jgi:hypothetical protein
MKSFLDDLRRDYGGHESPRTISCVIMVIGHRATQYGIEHVLNGVPLEKLVSPEALDAWKWQPGWVYEV